MNPRNKHATPEVIKQVEVFINNWDNSKNGEYNIIRLKSSRELKCRVALKLNLSADTDLISQLENGEQKLTRDNAIALLATTSNHFTGTKISDAAKWALDYELADKSING